MRIIVDTSSLFYGFQVDGENEYFTTSSALEEVRGKRMKWNLELRNDLLKVWEPSKTSVQEVKISARESGDLDQLSNTDIELIALAVDKGASLLTNDLAIQNVCRRIGIRYQSFRGKEIRTEIEWGYRCTGCNRRFKNHLSECPHCGSELKKYPRRRRELETDPSDL